MKIEEIIMTNPSNFPGKLWQLVNDPQIGSICWDNGGKAIIIHQKQFIAEVLLSKTKEMNEYFKTRDFSSIVRQLNLYGFRKVRYPDVSEQQFNCSSVTFQLHHFHNPNFERDKPELLVNLKRLTLANKAKLGLQNMRSSQCVNHVMLKSPQENCAVMKKGSLDQCDCKSNEKVKECDSTPKSTHAFVLGHVGPAPGTFYTNKVDWSCAHPSSPVYLRHVMPHHLPHRFYTQVYQSCTPGILHPKVKRFQQPAASYSPCNCYPDYSIRYLHPTDLSPSWKAGAGPDSRNNEMNLDSI